MGDFIVLCVIVILALSPLLRRFYIDRFWIHARGRRGCVGLDADAAATSKRFRQNGCMASVILRSNGVKKRIGKRTGTRAMSVESDRLFGLAKACRSLARTCISPPAAITYRP